jgi:hypothetical protein
MNASAKEDESSAIEMGRTEDCVEVVERGAEPYFAIAKKVVKLCRLAREYSKSGTLDIYKKEATANFLSP